MISSRVNASDSPVQLMGSQYEWFKLPTSIRSSIKKNGIPRLQNLRHQIQNDAGLSMPYIRIEPWGWINPSKKPVHGLVRILQLGKLSYYACIIPASTLIIIPHDDLLRRIICHEFAHCFWYYERMILASLSSLDGVFNFQDDVTMSTEEYFSRAIREDKEKLVEPSQWFGKWDVEHFLSDPLREDDDEGADIIKRMNRRWIKLGLPTCIPSFISSGEGTWQIPQDIVDRVKEIHGIHGV